MIDILIENNGIPTELEDPECSHVVSTIFVVLFFKFFFVKITQTYFRYFFFWYSLHVLCLMIFLS